MNAAECLSAAERCEPRYRGLTLAIAASWLSLARQQTAMDELLAIRLGGFMLELAAISQLKAAREPRYSLGIIVFVAAPCSLRPAAPRRSRDMTGGSRL
jgi:hypothetical protein